MIDYTLEYSEMSKEEQKELTLFMQKIGYEFNNLQLLKQALTHCSFNNVNNEKLEFLGDSLLNYIIGHELYCRLPNANEGELTKIRSSIVKDQTLAIVARKLSLGEVLFLGRGEMKNRGYERESILAGAIEALIGAIALDSNLASCYRIIVTWFTQYLENSSITNIYRDPKSILQEYLHAKGEILPEYILIAKEGPDHDQRFKIECKVENLNYATVGYGSNRRLAEQDAAKKIIRYLNFEK